MKSSVKTIQINEKLLRNNDGAAQKNRKRFDANSVFALNVIAAPGAGKTSVIQKTIQGLAALKVSVIEGDIASSIDAERVLEAGAYGAVQINTAGKCHLEAPMLEAALNELELPETDFVFIENVGNLICPTAWNLGEHLSVCLLSAAEGDDKALKYPEVFARSDVILVNKMDLIPYVSFDIDFFYKHLKALNPQAPVFELSCRTGEGFDNWLAFLKEQRDCFLKARKLLKKEGNYVQAYSVAR